MNSNKQGFTLMELMTVMAIISILAAIAMPQYQDYLKKGRDTAIKVLMMEIGSKQREYRLAKGAFLPCPLNPATPHAVWVDRDAWKELRFSPSHTLYGYQLKVEATKSGFVASAIKDGKVRFTADQASYEVTDQEDKKAK